MAKSYPTSYQVPSTHNATFVQESDWFAQNDRPSEDDMQWTFLFDIQLFTRPSPWIAVERVSRSPTISFGAPRNRTTSLRIRRTVSCAEADCLAGMK